MPPQVFIDTNVWFSAFHGSPNSEKIITAHINNHIQAVISQQVLHELVSNIARKLPSALPALQQLLESAPPKIIKDPPHIPPIPKLENLAHPKDLPIISAAISAKIPTFVTGNIKDFNTFALKNKFDISILNPSQFVTQMLK